MFVMWVSEMYRIHVFWVWVMGGVAGWGSGFGFGGMFGWSVCGVDKCFKRWGGGLGWRELATFRIPIRFLDLNLSPTLN